MKKPILYAAVAAVSGLLILAVSAYVQSETANTYNKNLPLIALGDNARYKTTKAHLWFEEHLAGDKSIDYTKDVLAYLQSCDADFAKASGGGITELGTYQTVDPATEIGAVLIDARSQLKNMIEITSQREQLYKLIQESNGSEAMIGNGLDQKFDAVYEELQSSMNKLVNLSREQTKADTKKMRLFGYASLAFILSVTFAASYSLYSAQHKNDFSRFQQEQTARSENARLRTLSDFVGQIAAQNFLVELPASDNDLLAKSLLDMRNRLREVSQEDQTKKWLQDGIAATSGLLQGSQGDIPKITDSILSFLVKQLGGSQGYFYIRHDDSDGNTILKLAATYAHDGKRFLEPEILPGEGLAGQCFLNGETAIMSDLPEDYAKIVSATGDSPVKQLLFVPLKSEGKTMGLIEIGSLETYPQYFIDFLERISPNIASSIMNANNSELTQKLLAEMRDQSGMLKVQEEQMLHSIGEMMAAQEQSERRAKELEAALLHSQKETERLLKVQGGHATRQT